MKIGIIREGKNPPDKRVPFSPLQCKEILAQFDVELVVQPSNIRCYSDAEYVQEGITLQENLSDCDVLMGVKEVPKTDLIPGKQYFFFSHTIKKQPYNASLLGTILKKKIQLTDYETLTHKDGGRILGFGRYAGIVGAYNGLLAWGKRYGTFDLKPANLCLDYAELKTELKKVVLPAQSKIVLTGTGRVGQGALEIMNALGFKQVSPEAFLNETFESPVFTALDCGDYYQTKDGSPFETTHFYKNPAQYKGNFVRFTKVADIFISCHYWDHNADVLFSVEDMKDPAFKIQVVADITCDINGSVPTTIRPSTIDDPIYGIEKMTGQEVAGFGADSVTVMAVDNLPCELPRDASFDFGNALMKSVMPCLIKKDVDDVIARASITTKEGELNEGYTYLEGYPDFGG